MTATESRKSSKGRFSVSVEPVGAERREHRRHDMEQQGIPVDRWDGTRRTGKAFGKLVDISASGVRIRMAQSAVRADHQIRVKLELPTFAGICPFVERKNDGLAPKREWVGWMAVTRVIPVDNKEMDVAGRLVDMDEIDRGMLGLYLSTQPMAA